MNGEDFTVGCGSDEDARIRIVGQEAIGEGFGRVVEVCCPHLLSGGPIECDEMRGRVVGSWSLDLDSFVDSFEATLRATGRTADVSASSGSATISLEENGQVAGIFEDFTVQTDLGEDSEPIELVLAGAIVGTWSVQENKLVLTPDLERTTFKAQSPMEITDTGNSGVYNFEVGGDSQALARSYPLPIALGSPSIITCEGDTLTIGPERGRSPTIWNRS